MVTCEMDQEISGEVLGLKIPGWQALLLHRVLPSCGGLAVYLTLMCYDFALICQHYQLGHNGMAAFCIVLMVLPALIGFIFTLASPHPGLKIDDSTLDVTIQKSYMIWILKQLLALIFFPVAAIGRYCHEVFWWIEAVCASWSSDKDRTRDAIARAKEPSSMELYLFLQAFIHSAPHTIFNILDLMARVSDPAFGKVTLQGISIIVSTMRMASTASYYRRFEREKICGRIYPWTNQIINKITPDDTKLVEQQVVITEENIYEEIIMRKRPTSDTSQVSKKAPTFVLHSSNLIQFSPSIKENPISLFDDEFSDTSSDSGITTANKENELNDNSDDEYLTPVTIIQKTAPYRRDTIISKVDIPPPPGEIAPRPLSLSAWAGKMVENAESIPIWLSAPPRRRHFDDMIIDEPDLPTRVPRSYIRGLEPPDITASLVHYLGWYLFFISRLLSIAAFINLHPVAAIIILLSHYQVMLLLLIVPPASTIKRAFYMFLAFIYIFCLMEFKIRFRHVRVWHVFWIIACTVETIVFAGLWNNIDNTLGDWWRAYVMIVIFVSVLLSVICFICYFILLQPKEKIVHFVKK